VSLELTKSGEAKASSTSGEAQALLDPMRGELKAHLWPVANRRCGRWPVKEEEEEPKRKKKILF